MNGKNFKNNFTKRSEQLEKFITLLMTTDYAYQMLVVLS